MKSGRQCHDCLQTIHKKCEEKFNIDTICLHEPIQIKSSPVFTLSEDDLKNIVHIELPDTTTADDSEASLIKPNETLTAIPNNNRTTTPTTTTTAYTLSTKAAAAFSALDSTARRSFRAFGHRNPNQPTTVTPTNLTPTLLSTSELSKSDESLQDPSIVSTKKPTVPTTHTSSKIAHAASSAYSKLREFKSKRLPVATEPIPIKKPRLPSDSSRI
jgi:hypothetical protein